MVERHLFSLFGALLLLSGMLLPGCASVPGSDQVMVPM